MQTVFILSCDTPENGGGIYKYALTENGLVKQKYCACDRPMYAVIDNERLYVLLRQPFNSEESGVFSLDLGIENSSEILSTNGKVACHLAVDKGDIYVVNYLSGNIVKISKKIVVHSGVGVNPIRQDMPHTHCAFFSNEKKYLLCCDLGLDTLFCYDRELNELSKVQVPEGYGIRHAVFSKDGKYVYAITEMIPSVCVFSFKDGELGYIKKYDIECEKINADGAGIRLSKDGKFLYVSLRVENSIVAYEVKKDNLKLLQKVNCGGDSPRDFNLIGNKLVVANEKSNSIIVFDLKKGIMDKKIQTLELSKPLCVVC